MNDITHLNEYRSAKRLRRLSRIDPISQALLGGVIIGIVAHAILKGSAMTGIQGVLSAILEPDKWKPYSFSNELRLMREETEERNRRTEERERSSKRLFWITILISAISITITVASWGSR